MADRRKFNQEPAGAADEELFIKLFEEVPRVTFYTSKELDEELQKIRDLLSDATNDWEKRVEALRKIRCLLIAGAADYDEFYLALKTLDIPFQVSVKDLRSQVVREACITVAYISQRIGIKCDRFAEVLLPSLINQIPNSARIMATSAVTCIRFIIQNTPAHRLIPIITYHLINSKSNKIRKACCEFLDQLLHTWPTHALERHVPNLQEAIKKGINDADPEARTHARRAFWGFADHFKDQAQALLLTLDSSKQRMLQGENGAMGLALNTNNHQSSVPNHRLPSRPGSSYSGGSVENLSRPHSSLSSRHRSGIPIFSPKPEVPASGRAFSGASSSASSQIDPSQLKSSSVIDVGATKRAKARAAYLAALALHKPNQQSVNIRPAQRTTSNEASSHAAASYASPERTGRSKSRVSQSLPSSRSASPSSRLNYYTMRSGQRVRRKSGIPQPTTSREGSPSRAGFTSMERRLSGSRPGYRSSTENIPQTPRSHLMAEKILQQSKEAEFALADALTTVANTSAFTRRRTMNTFEDHSDESETSSVCSDISFGSFPGRKIEEVSDIIEHLSSAHWSDRKEGLLGLQTLFRHTNRTLNPQELRRVTDIFTKMLLDPHTKTFTLFLDILNELIMIHKQDLNSWLYILMTRLFLKMGTDTLGSVHVKIIKTLDLIRESFNSRDQLNVTLRFLSDQAQAPNVKVKIAVLQFFAKLIQTMDPNELRSIGSNSHEMQLALMKIISWTADPKSQELRRYAQEVILLLFNLNTAEFSLLLLQLPKTYQDAAFQLIHMKRRSLSNSNESPQYNNVTMRTPRGYNVSSRTCPPPQNDRTEYDDTENLNPEEIYNSLKRTTAEIQRYTSDADHGDERVQAKINSNSNPTALNNSPGISPKRGPASHKSIKEFSSASQDSGISQIDCGLGNNHKRQTPTPSSDGSPVKLLSPTPGATNGISMGLIDLAAGDSPLSTTSAFSNVISNLRNGSRDVEIQRDYLNDLADLIREGTSAEWTKHFKDVLRILLEKVADNEYSAIRALALRVLSELLMKQTKYFNDDVEVTILKVLEASRDPEKEVQRASEACAGTAAAVLPSEICVKILRSIILTSESTITQAAIKMLTKLVEQQPTQVVIDLLPDIMPPLVQAYDNPESAVRKAAVFSMVAVHGVVGEQQIRPYLSSLNGSKMKLLRLYIERAKGQSSGSSSPSSLTTPAAVGHAC